MQESIGCLPRLKLVPGSAGSASDEKENIREILCDMITAALSEGGIGGSA
jgi:hypothetical protein